MKEDTKKSILVGAGFTAGGLSITALGLSPNEAPLAIAVGKYVINGTIATSVLWSASRINNLFNPNEQLYETTTSPSACGVSIGLVIGLAPESVSVVTAAAFGVTGAACGLTASMITGKLKQLWRDNNVTECLKQAWRDSIDPNNKGITRDNEISIS